MKNIGRSICEYYNYKIFVYTKLNEEWLELYGYMGNNKERMKRMKARIRRNAFKYNFFIKLFFFKRIKSYKLLKHWK